MNEKAPRGHTILYVAITILLILIIGVAWGPSVADAYRRISIAVGKRVDAYNELLFARAKPNRYLEIISYGSAGIAMFFAGGRTILDLLLLAHNAVRFLAQSPVHSRRKKTVAEVMASQYELRAIRSGLLLFVAVIIGGISAWIDPSRRTMMTSVLLCIGYVLATARQALLAFRIRRRLFGTSEHEVRQLLTFVLNQPPESFSGGGGTPLPAFDLDVDDGSSQVSSASSEGAI